MRRVVPWPLLAFAVGACGATGQEVSTTPAPTSTPQSTSTTQSITTSSTAPSTTSTIVTTITTTTTTTLLEGNWAHEPLIVTPIGDLALGWWDGSQWVQPGEETTLPVEGSEHYQTVVLGSVGRTVGGPQIRGCDIRPTTFPGVELEEADLRVPETDRLGWSPHGIAISAPWDVTPHHISSPGANDPAHQATAARLLAELGLDVESPRIRQVIDTDLNGDGGMESLVVVDGDDPPVVDREGYYSLVFHVDSRDGEATVIEQSDHPISYRVGAIADLNGDGVMEVILSHLEIESSGTGVYEWIQATGQFAHRLRAGCGL